MRLLDYARLLNKQGLNCCKHFEQFILNRAVLIENCLQKFKI